MSEGPPKEEKWDNVVDFAAWKKRIEEKAKNATQMGLGEHAFDEAFRSEETRGRFPGLDPRELGRAFAELTLKMLEEGYPEEALEVNVLKVPDREIEAMIRHGFDSHFSDHPAYFYVVYFQELLDRIEP